jgi:hypothetical protein
LSIRARPSSELIPAGAFAPTVAHGQRLGIIDVVSNLETQPYCFDQPERLKLGEARGETDERSLMIEREARGAMREESGEGAGLNRVWRFRTSAQPDLEPRNTLNARKNAENIQFNQVTGKPKSTIDSPRNGI